jgi:polysaccharide deacetylase 2 family uncharacterized protein YibQ
LQWNSFFLYFLGYSYKILRESKSNMAKRKKKKNSSTILTYIAWSLAIIAFVLSALVAGYYFGYEDGQANALKNEKKNKEKSRVLLQKLEKTSKQNKSVNKRLKEVLKKEYVSASHEFDDTPQSKPPKAPKREIKRTIKKPKLAIIIDDVGTRMQVRAIKSVHIPLTMSFLPPSNARPNSAKLAANENFYMVHLPMEAMNWSAEEPLTLRVNDSQEKITQRIEKLKRLFPKVHYINNHTGSKFTSNEIAMNRLINALNKNNINFIDSRTTAQTKAPQVMKNFGFKYVARDVFLDHHMDKAYVLKQIKQAVKEAKLHGTAIAIGHPHPNTLQALKESKKVLDEVDVVFVNRLY